MNTQFSNSVRVLLVAWTALALSSCSNTPAPTRPAPGSSALIVDRLSFGRNIPTGGVVDDAALNKFLEEVVTPRFPDGYAITHGEGRWRLAGGRIEGEKSFFVEVFHAPGAVADSTLENIAKEYIRRFNQEAVARTRFAAERWIYWGVKPH